MTDLNLSWPAVSQICSQSSCPATLIILSHTYPNRMLRCSFLNLPSTKRCSAQDLPVPVSPMMMNLKTKSLSLESNRCPLETIAIILFCFVLFCFIFFCFLHFWYTFMFMFASLCVSLFCCHASFVSLYSLNFFVFFISGEKNMP